MEMAGAHAPANAVEELRGSGGLCIHIWLWPRVIRLLLQAESGRLHSRAAADG
jgi:hypothetical protein